MEPLITPPADHRYPPPGEFYFGTSEENWNGIDSLTADIIELARQYGRYGYRKVAALLRQGGWTINDKRVERIWQREGLKVPHKQPKLADGSCIRLRPQQRNHVWSYDFVEDRTHEGRKYRMLNVLDEFTHECLAIRVARKLKAIDVIDVLSDLFILRGVPAYIRSDNGPEFLAKAVQEWIAVVGAKTAYIERGSPWENGYGQADCVVEFAISQQPSVGGHHGTAKLEHQRRSKSSRTASDSDSPVGFAITASRNPE
jgi:transposase InsO family protein